MKLNPQLLARLSSSNIDTQNFVKRLEEQKKKKLDPEQFANSQSNFRVRTINEQKEKEESNTIKLQQSFYKEQGNALQLSQLTRSTNIQNSQIIETSSPKDQINGVGARKALNSRPMISVKMQSSLIIKRPSQPQLSNKSNVFENDQNFPQPQQSARLLLKKIVPQSPSQVSIQMQMQMQNSMMNKSTLTNKPPNQSLNTSLISDNANKSIIMQPPQTKMLIGRIRGLSQIGTKKTEPPQPIPKQFRQVTSSVNKTIQDIPQPKINSSFSTKNRMIRGVSLCEKEIAELEIHESITEQTITEITSKQLFEFDSITKVSMRFNSQHDSLQMLGEFLPSLIELRLDKSVIPSLRDLGTRLQGLRILWISRSQIKDISGVNGLFNLKELYCCFNNISDLSPLAYHENLEVLDAEANDISDECQIDFLESLDKLEFLNLVSNPILKNFPKQVSERLFTVLNGVDETDALSDQISQDYEYTNNVDKLYELAQQIFDFDELRLLNTKLKEDLKFDWEGEPDELNMIAEQIKAVKPISKDTNKQLRPQTAMSRSTVQNESKGAFHLFNYDNEMNPDPTSTLTQMQDEVLCGNPIKAARYNRSNKGGFDPSDRKSMDIRNIMKQFQL